jgi:hypothetical protein
VLNKLVAVGKALDALASRRPIFHSEADFQHALAWELQLAHPSAHVRLEVPFRSTDGAEYLDLFIQERGQRIAIELKYKTRALDCQYHGESFHLQNHSAHDIGRYDFLKDIRRLERFVGKGSATVGYAILLSNDASYWTEPRRMDTVDAMFRLHNGHVIKGQVAWGKRASAGTMRSREQPIRLSGRYEVRWREYSAPSEKPGGTFCYLALRVEANG